MFDFGGDINQSVQVLLAFTGRIRFFGVSITEMIYAMIAIPFVIWVIQRLIKTFSPVPLDFEPVTGSIYDPEWNAEVDKNAINDFLDGNYNANTPEAISNYRDRQRRYKQLNGGRK